MIWRLRLAWAYREWPWRIPKACRYIDTTRPPEQVFAHFRRLHGKDETERIEAFDREFVPWCDTEGL